MKKHLFKYILIIITLFAFMTNASADTCSCQNKIIKQFLICNTMGKSYEENSKDTCLYGYNDITKSACYTKGNESDPFNVYKYENGKCALYHTETVTNIKNKVDCYEYCTSNGYPRVIFNTEIVTKESAESAKSEKSGSDYENPEIFIQDNFCDENDVRNLLKIVGEILNILKVIVPAIIIVLGTKNVAYAVVAKDDKEMSKAFQSLIKKIVVGICIFFVPTIVNLVFSSLSSFPALQQKFDGCRVCVLEPSKCTYESDAGSDFCNSVLGDLSDKHQLAYYLDYAFKIAKYGGLVLCIVMASVDIIKFVLDPKDDAGALVKTVLQRIIYAIVLFFLPTIVQLLLLLMGVVSNCGIS